MSTQKRTTEIQAEQNSQQKSKPDLALEQTEKHISVENLKNILISSIGDDPVHNHSVLLNNTQITAVQRQKIAAQIGQVAGNRYLQKALSHNQNRSDEKSNEAQQDNIRVSSTSIEQQQIPYPNIATLSKSGSVVMRNGRSENRSRGARPRNAPRGTKPIDQTGLDHDQIHDIKEGVGARPADWVGISPEGHVITTDSEGNAEDHGHWEDYTNSRIEIPDWLWKALVGVALAAGTLAVIACFASGACELGALIGALGYSAALIIIGLLGGSGESEGSTASVERNQTDYNQTNPLDGPYA